MKKTKYPSYPQTRKSSGTKTNLLNGMIKRHPDGFGFFIPEDPEHPDVYIPRHSMEGVMTNDKVQIQAERERGSERYRGEIVKILERGVKTIVGPYLPLPNGGGVIRDEGKGWGADLKLDPNPTLLAKKGELVAAEVVTYPDEGEFRGRLTQILGDIMDPMTDIQRVLLSQHIPQKWPSAVLKEASSIQEEVQDKDMQGRTDLRHLPLITIDGATAKDFDDAIYVEMNDLGFVLYVAIADVSHYVQVGSPIDQEAYQRGTSVYFPNFVVPMLPEVLSNGLCSLNPHVNRLCLVSEIHMDFQGEVQETRFYEAVMKSAARVTYGEAQEIIDGGEIDKLTHVKEDILRASQLAKILMAKRFREGSLDLEIPEVQLVIDGGGNPIDILKSERLFAHRLIEEMMLAANVAVAKFFAEKEIPAIYRIHEPPNPEAIATLEKFLRNFGSRIDLGQGKLQKRLTRALEEFQGQPQAQILNILTLRSMSQAKYSENNVGHFGLGFEFYTHFTSPIRRYPDLIVHRLIKSQILRSSRYRLMSEDDLATAGQMLSACEQRSVRAERQVQGIKKARFMTQFIGQEFEGMISSVTKFGMFVLLRQYEVDGLVPLDQLGKSAKDTYEFDPENLRLVARRSGEAFEIGQMVKIRVADANSELGQVDFELIRESKQSSKWDHHFDPRHHELQNANRVAARPTTPYGAKSRPQVSSQAKSSSSAQESSRGRGHKGKSAEPTARSNDKAESQPRGRMERFQVGQKVSGKEAPTHVDELDLDRLEVRDHSLRRDVREDKPQSSFDPERKLREALAKRGLTPTQALQNPESVRRLGERPIEKESSSESSRGFAGRSSFQKRGSSSQKQKKVMIPASTRGAKKASEDSKDGGDTKKGATKSQDNPARKSGKGNKEKSNSDRSRSGRSNNRGRR